MPYRDAILWTPNVFGYWPLDDAVGSLPADATPKRNNLSRAGNAPYPIFGRPGLLPNKLETGTSVRFPYNNDGNRSWFTANPSTAPSFASGGGPINLPQSYEAWILPLNDPSISIFPTSFGGGVIAMVNGGIWSWLGASMVYDGATILTGASVGDGKVHYMVGRITPGGATDVWVDGLLTRSGTTGSFTNSGDLRVGSSGYSQPFYGDIQHAAFYSGIISPHRIRQHYRVGMGYEQREKYLNERLYVPNAQCPQRGSFDIKDAYAVQFSDVQSWGGILTADPTYRNTLLNSGYFTEMRTGMLADMELAGVN